MPPYFTIPGKSATITKKRIVRNEEMTLNNYFEMNFTPAQVNGISSLGLAHVGDGVFELLCRAYLCVKGDSTVKTLHRDAVGLVNATAQARFADALLPHLTEDELGYFRRGKNAHTHAAPKAATAKEYAKATGVETLFGALYLMGQTERLNAVFSMVMEELYGI